MEPAARVACTILSGIGGILVLVYLLQGLRRSYLMFLGLGFIALGVALALPKSLLLTLAVALALFIMGFIDAVRDSKARLRKFRADQQQREEAFADMMQAIAKKEAEPPADAPAQQGN